MIFEIVLVIAVLLTGIVTLVNRVWLIKKRASDAKEPVIIEYSRSFFPVLFLVLMLRSFVADPWRIPSGSMKPTLLEGDFIVVGKYKYGLRLPVLGTKIIDVGTPKRGDVVVFRNKKVGLIMIKRVVGLPGDHVQYIDNKLYINGKEMATNTLGLDRDTVLSVGLSLPVTKKEENLDGVSHNIFVRDDLEDREYSFSDVVVPEGSYFLMGDNRNNSNDSRAWGFVPDKDLLGKALFTVFSWDTEFKDIRWSRTAKKIK